WRSAPLALLSPTQGSLRNLGTNAFRNRGHFRAEKLKIGAPSMRDIPTLADREELETSSTDARARPQPVVVTPKQALSIKPFGLDMDVLLTTEATGGATSVIVAWHKPGEGLPDHVHFKQEEILFIIEGLSAMRTPRRVPAASSSSRATLCTASRTSAASRDACWAGACRVGRTITSKRSPSLL